MSNVDNFDTFDSFDELMDETSVVEDTGVVLQEVNVAQEINKNISENMSFPCVMISGINTAEEVSFFNKRETSDKALPLYIDFNGYVKQIGMFELSLNNLLITRCISNYEVRLYKNKKDFMKINLHAPEHLIKFITI